MKSEIFPSLEGRLSKVSMTGSLRNQEKGGLAVLFLMVGISLLLSNFHWLKSLVGMVLIFVAAFSFYRISQKNYVWRIELLKTMQNIVTDFDTSTYFSKKDFFSHSLWESVFALTSESDEIEKIFFYEIIKDDKKFYVIDFLLSKETMERQIASVLDYYAFDKNNIKVWRRHTHQTPSTDRYKPQLVEVEV